MNEVLTQLRERKSVRVFTDRPVEQDVKQAVLEAALQAPTAGNMSLFTVLDIADPEIKAALAKSCDNQPFIATAPMVLIFCADYQRWYDVFCKHCQEVRLPQEGDLFLAQADAIIAAQNAVVAAHSLGLGSCYIGDITENFEFHQKLLNLPKYAVPAAMLCIGYPTEQQMNRPKPPRFAVADLVHENGYDPKKADMGVMLMERNDIPEEELGDFVRRFCNRKWNSEFSCEMSRSCAQIIRSWCRED